MRPLGPQRPPPGTTPSARAPQPGSTPAKPAPAAPPELPPTHDPSGVEVRELSFGQILATFGAGLFGAGPLPLARVPEVVRFALAKTLPADLAGALKPTLHAGLGANPLDIAAVAEVTGPARAALGRYLDPGFPRLPAEEKRAVLGAIGGLLLPGAQLELARFHLPRPFGADSAGQPLTYAMEAEQILSRRPELLDYYAPHPEGLLDPDLVTDQMLAKATPAKLPQVWLRMAPAEQKKHLRWKNLSFQEKANYLLRYRDEVDPKATLHRIKDPTQTPSGRVVPDSLQDTIKWEGHTPLRCAEIITKEKYDAFDHLYADIAFVQQLGKSQPGFHVHHVVELSTPEDTARLGPGLTGLVTLQDLQIFAAGVKNGGNLLNHTHLEVWQASGTNEVVDSLKTGAIDQDAVGIHKFHCVGMRAGLYGDPKRLGIEVRAVAMGDDVRLQKINERLATILAEGHFTKLPAPPWDGWNAGDPQLPAQVEAAARKDPRFAGHAEGAELDFGAVLELAAGEHAKRDTFRYASPLWAFEKLPGVTAEEAAQIGAARDRFVALLFRASAALSEAIAAGREIDAPKVQAAVTQEIRRFFASARIDAVLERVLDGVAGGAAP